MRAPLLRERRSFCSSAFDAIILPSLSALIMIPSNSQEYLRQAYPPLRSLSLFPRLPSPLPLPFTAPTCMS